LVSPDFDPNNPKAHDPDRINRLTTGVFEMGSTFQDADAGDGWIPARRRSIRSTTRAALCAMASSAIHDTHPLGRSISLSEVFTFSSNVGAARVALGQGVEAHRAF
jgi:cell division protein FtsI (penicillin-binding protein 3)